MSDDASRAFDLSAEQPVPNAFIQWKGTDVCMDVQCECGAALHHDGYFANVVQCPHCQAIYEMPAFVYPRRVSDPGPHHTPQVMERDDELTEP